MESPLERRILELLRSYGVAGERLAQGFAGAHGLHPTDLRALIVVLEAEQTGGTATPRTLREQLRLTSGAVTATIDRLEGHELVLRSRESADRRQVRLHPTDRARALAREYFGGVAERGAQVLGEFEPGELEVVQRFLTRINEVVAAPESARHAGS